MQITKLSKKTKLQAAQKVSITLLNKIEEYRFAKFPSYLLIVIGASLGYHKMPGSESWVHAGKSFNMRKICDAILSAKVPSYVQVAASYKRSDANGDPIIVVVGEDEEVVTQSQLT